MTFTFHIEQSRLCGAVQSFWSVMVRTWLLVTTSNSTSSVVSSPPTRSQRTTKPVPADPVKSTFTVFVLGSFV